MKLSMNVSSVGIFRSGAHEKRNGRRLDGNAALALQIHVIEHLVMEFALGNGPARISRRSERVDLPWSIWAMMEKLRICIEWLVFDC